ncbi:hypothetical protein, partial [Solemya velum gill symbiont]|uniref:hypothetical protein n=1 Tax=Solemya velum gill symbiont TaxID=2340 RepID=UPI001E2AB48A
MHLTFCIVAVTPDDYFFKEKKDYNPGKYCSRYGYDPPPISWSTLMMRKTEDQKWESSDTNRKRSSR